MSYVKIFENNLISIYIKTYVNKKKFCLEIYENNEENIYLMTYVDNKEYQENDKLIIIWNKMIVYVKNISNYRNNQQCK